MNKGEVIDILSSNELKAQSRFGQNFLCDDDVIDEIISIADIKPVSSVLEIGPGLGALTEGVLDITSSYKAVEIDHGLFEYLNERFGDHFIHSDFLKLERQDYYNGEDVILSNIPYYIMTPIMKKLMVECDKAQKMVFMVEDEAVQRIIAAPGTKQYGPLSVLCSCFGIVKKEFSVPANCFYPMPHTLSSVISLTRNLDIVITEDFCDLIEASFSKRRKTLNNSLSDYLSSKKTNIELKEALRKLNLSENIRAEALKPDDFIELHKLLLL